LRHANQPNLTEEKLRQVLLLDERQFERICGATAGMIGKEASPT